MLAINKAGRAQRILGDIAELQSLSRFEKALLAASRLHANQIRKGAKIPYFSHLAMVASLVLEAGGDEDLAIAALLHDSVEDQDAELADIERLFGSRVARIVQGCTAVVDDEIWADRSSAGASMERKRLYLEHLKGEENPDVLRVSLADKLHNARAILGDYRRVGEELWGRFNVSRDEQLWYYEQLADIFERKMLERKMPGDSQVKEFTATVDQLFRESGAEGNSEDDRPSGSARAT